MSNSKQRTRRSAIVLVVIVSIGLLWAVVSRLEPASLSSWVTDWYAFLNNIYLFLGLPLNNLARGIRFPVLSALLLGIVGALSPCQLSTGAAALAYLSPQATQGRSFAGSVVAYVMGKVVVYFLLGGAVLLAGFQMNDSIPVIQAVRKLLGPLMLLLGAYFLGWIPLQFTLGLRASNWLEGRFAGRGVRGAFALGIAFGLAFCPTLFLLFFGLLLPLALTQPLGAAYPALFALGTTVPLVLLAVGLRMGLKSVGATVRRAGRLDRGVRWAAAAVLLLSGVNDTVVYWFV